LDQQGLSLVDQSEDRSTLVLADRSQLRQVLFNLLSNAIALAPKASKIEFRLTPSRRGTFRLEIIDQGPGVPEEIVDSLFEPYVSRRAGGTGLGLSIVRRIAVAHNWEVGYKSGVHGGSVFWIDGIRVASETEP
jgi:signal transduction histidine kinase